MSRCCSKRWLTTLRPKEAVRSSIVRWGAGDTPRHCCNGWVPMDDSWGSTVILRRSQLHRRGSNDLAIE